MSGSSQPENRATILFPDPETAWKAVLKWDRHLEAVSFLVSLVIDPETAWKAVLRSYCFSPDTAIIVMAVNSEPSDGREERDETR